MTAEECPICCALVPTERQVEHEEWHRHLRMLLTYAHGAWPAHDEEIRRL
jgi:hypothetical protein